jgi:hypothetical protein
LRLFLLQLENKQESGNEIEFPMALHPKVEGNLVIFERIYTSITQAEELVNLVHIMENRGWKVIVE